MTQDVCKSLEFTFTCTLPSGLHARPASHLSDLANRFVSDSALTNLRTGLSANAKSVLAIIAADVRHGDDCAIRVRGADEEVAYSTLRQFIEQDLPSIDESTSEFSANGHGGMLPRPLRHERAKCHFGLSVSRGIGQGRVALVGSITLPHDLGVDGIQGCDVPGEQEKIERAVAAVRARIEALLSRQSVSTEVAVLKAHLAIVSDISLKDKLNERIAQGRSAGHAVVEGGEFFIDILRRSESLYIRERAIDVQEICLQLLEELYGRKFQASAVQLTGPSVVVAETLAPQQLLSLDRKQLNAIVLGSAGLTSHTVILARSLGIPTLVAVKDAPLILASGEEVVVDATRGFVLSQDTPQINRFYQREIEMQRRRGATLARYAMSPAVTSDGQKLEVGANVSSSAEVVSAFEKGADGIGLFRTEMLFVGRDDAPSEEEQCEIYAQSARAAGDRPVIIRTMDIGGDKPVPHLSLAREANPFLGYRGVRLYAENEDLIHMQFRAIMRASAFGRVQMMVPMVSCIEEVLWIKDRVARVQEELKSQRVAFDPAMKIGIMIEVPSVAFILDQLCRELDFFSIGTNDLAQYFLAVDRDNAKVAHLSDVRRPSFVRFLKQIVEQVRSYGKWIGICGEMASDIRYLPLLLGLGFDEISVTASEIPALKERVSRLRGEECKQVLSRILTCREVTEVGDVLGNEQPIQSSRPLLDRELVIFDSESANKEEAIRELVNALYVAGRTADPDSMEEAIWARESVYSTGLGYGFAVPHCKTDAVTTGTLGILKLKQPVEWDSVDGSPVHMVILLALRETDTNTRHMQVFSRLARKLMNEEFRKELTRLNDAGSVLAYMSKELDSGL